MINMDFSITAQVKPNHTDKVFLCGDTGKLYQTMPFAEQACPTKTNIIEYPFWD